MLRSLLSVRNWQQLGKFCAVGASAISSISSVYDALLHEKLHYLVAATCSFLVAVTSNYTGTESGRSGSTAVISASRGCGSSSSRLPPSGRTSSCSTC
jgi:GtrA-like protein.